MMGAGRKYISAWPIFTNASREWAQRVKESDGLIKKKKA